MCYQLMKERGVLLRERQWGPVLQISLSCRRNLMQMVLPVPGFLSPGISEYQRMKDMQRTEWRSENVVQPMWRPGVF